MGCFKRGVIPGSEQFVEESAGPLLIVAVIFTFFATICSFLLIFKIYRLVVIALVFTHSFAVIFAWIGIGVFAVNPFLGSPERVVGLVHAGWSLIITVLAAVLLTLLLPLIVIYFCFADTQVHI